MDAKIIWTDQLLSNGLSLVSPGKDKLQILIYHRVLPEFDPLQPDIVTVGLFEEQIRLMSRFFNVLPLDEALNRLKQKTLPPKSLCITFDDGYRDNVELALPILQKYNVTASFFIATGFLHGRAMFNDRLIEYVRNFEGAVLDLSDYSLGHYHLDSLKHKYDAIHTILAKLKHLPFCDRGYIVEQLCGPLTTVEQKLMMRPHHVRKLRDANMEIGAHTVNHPILSCMPLSQAKEEIIASKQDVEQILGHKIKYFAYPNGKPGQDFTTEHEVWVKKCGFTAALSTQWGVVNSSSNWYQLSRFTPWDKRPFKFMLRLLQYRHQISEEAAIT